MSTPHPLAAIIRAWAEGKKIQWARRGPLKTIEPDWLDWVETQRGSPSFDLFYLWRVKPSPKWEKEREAFARGERIQWRSTCKQHAGMGWLDVHPKSPGMGPAFDEPTNEFRIPHKWQAEMDAQARGEVVEGSVDGGKSWNQAENGWAFSSPVMIYRVKPKPLKWQAERDAFARGEAIQSRCAGISAGTWMNTMNPSWDDAWEYRIKPKTVTVRLRMAALADPNGEGEVWLLRADSDEEAETIERNAHFLCWLHDWKEIERPAPGILAAQVIRADKIADGAITCELSPLEAARWLQEAGKKHLAGADFAAPGADRAVIAIYPAPCGGWPLIRFAELIKQTGKKK